MWYLSHDLLGVGSIALRGICHPTDFLPHVDLACHGGGYECRTILFQLFDPFADLGNERINSANL